MNKFRWIVITVLVLALVMPATPVSAQSPSTSVTLSPPTPNPGVVGGDISFTLVLNVANIVPGVAGIDFYFSYPAPFVTPAPTIEPLSDFFGPSTVTDYDILLAGCPAPVVSPCIHLAAAGPAQVTRLGAVARFHFVGALAVPLPGACFGLTSSIVMVDANGIPVVAPPALPTPQCISIVPSNVTGIVLRQGRPAPPSLPPGTLACSTVQIISGGVVIFGPVVTSPAGAFAIPLPGSLSGGTHTLRAEYPGYLASQKTITMGTGGGQLDAGPTTLRGGDINGDNRINILDVGMVIGNFGAAAPVGSLLGCPLPPPLSLDPVDINDDGFITIGDLAIIAGSNFGMVGPTPWQ